MMKKTTREVLLILLIINAALVTRKPSIPRIHRSEHADHTCEQTDHTVSSKNLIRVKACRSFFICLHMQIVGLKLQTKRNLTDPDVQKNGDFHKKTNSQRN